MTPAERAARERKQKIFVAVGGLILVGLLAIQLPKLLGGSGGASDASATTLSSTPGSTSSTSTTAPANLVAGDQILAPQRGQLVSFSLLGNKDPFVQQVHFSDGVGSSSTAGSVAGSGARKKAPARPSTQAFTLGQQPIASMTVISVNGARQALVPGSRFPAADPVFVLVAEQSKTKSVLVAVAGGAYTSGSRTTKLVVGKPLVLVNTTTGARYKLVLVAVGSGEHAAKAEDKKTATEATTPTPAATSP
jgi:hypothetical protein